MKSRDTIVDDLHKLRERIGRAHGFDVERIAEAIRKHKREAGVALIEAKPQRSKGRSRPRIPGRATR